MCCAVFFVFYRAAILLLIMTPHPRHLNTPPFVLDPAFQACVAAPKELRLLT